MTREHSGLMSSGVSSSMDDYISRIERMAQSQEIVKQAQLPVQTSLDKQVGGEHYKRLRLQPWEIIDALDLDFYDGNALKYLLRWRSKGGVEDLKKAIHYIEHQIERYQAQQLQGGNVNVGQ